MGASRAKFFIFFADVIRMSSVSDSNIVSGFNKNTYFVVIKFRPKLFPFAKPKLSLVKKHLTFKYLSSNFFLKF
jgi:hypothetical protein